MSFATMKQAGYYRRAAAGRPVAPLALALLLLAAAASPAAGQPDAADRHVDLRWFFEAANPEDDDVAETALEQIEPLWRDGYAMILRDMLRLMQPPAPPRPTVDISDPNRPQPAFEYTIRREHPSTKVWRRFMEFAEDQTGERFRGEFDRLQQWIWSLPYEPHPDYALFKGEWFAAIDARFRQFFPRGVQATIRLDEIDWGGVVVNGIPPLEYPETLAAADADYLDDDHIVFGIAVDGETRAYPKRILAWHEMALDRLGGLELTIVYCTLCGTVIPYESVVDGQHIKIGTSGFLYRSNKLMFDHETRSLWNTFEGVPVVGPLVGSGLRLRHRSVVTTTWGEWRRTHPETTVLSLETGHRRDYSEGAAYRDYFSHDRLMFEVALTDDRLDNKDEVVVMQLADAAGSSQPLAIDVDFLRDNRVFQTEHAGHRLVVVTTRRGANRVFDAGDGRFTELRGDGVVVDDTGAGWRVTEDALVPEDATRQPRPRVAAQRAFWFGWYAQFPETTLIR